jgi:uncharacterized membrane protein
MKILRSARTSVSLPARYLSAIFLLSGMAFAGHAMATTYRAVVLPVPPDSTGAEAYDLNAAGDVVGYVSVDDNILPVEWSPPNYAVRFLPLSEEDVSSGFALAISDAGDITGFGYASEQSSYVPILWKSNGTYVRMATTTPRGGWTAGLFANNMLPNINIHGVVVGAVESMTRPVTEPGIWVNPQTLFVLKAPRNDMAYAVNDSGMVVGGTPYSTIAPPQAFRWRSGVGTQILQNLPGGMGSIAGDVNEFGQIVGLGYLSDETAESQRAVLWDADGSIHDLGHLPGVGYVGYRATRINNLGVVLGIEYADSESWLWTAGTGMLPLDSMIDPNDPLYGAGRFSMRDLNDAGILAGNLVSRTTGETSPVLLVPQP